VTWQPEIARLRRESRRDRDRCGPHHQPSRRRNQIEGAVVMGIGMALLEHTTYDPQKRRAD